MPGLIHELLCSHVGDAAAADRLGWAPLDDIAAAIVLDWADGDDVTPNVGPGLTKVGTVTAGKATPWRDPALAAVTCSEFAVNGVLHTGASTIDPGVDDDILWAALVRLPIDANLHCIYINRTNVLGGALYSNIGAFYYNESGTATYLTATPEHNTWCLIEVFKVRATGLTKLFFNGIEVDSEDMDSGDLGDGSYSVIGAVNSGGDYAYGLDLARIIVAHGALAATCDAAWHASLAEHVLGILPTVGTPGNSYARTTSGVYYPTGDPDDRVHLLSANCPPAGNAEGLGPDEEIVCCHSKNYGLVAGDEAGVTTYEHPLNGDGWDIIPAIADDTATLAAAGARELGPNILQLELIYTGAS